MQFGTVRFNDKPEARHKCGPGWERFTTRLDVAKLNMRLPSDSLESGTSSSNSLGSAKQPVFFVYILEKAETPREMRRSFSPQRTGERRPKPDSPDSASILSV